jgi:hypothetical protein
VNVSQTLFPIHVGTNAHDIPFVLPAEGAELSYQEILRVFEKLEEDPFSFR